MKQITMIIVALSLAACSQQAASDDATAVAQSAPRVITCHELIGGEPSPDASAYELVGREFYKQATGGERHLISSEDQLLNLGRHEDDEGPEDSFASHTVQGDVLTRTVLLQRPGQAPRTAFVERYDFREQTVVDAESGEDSCYHNAPPDDRTQEQAEWEALSGTGRGDMGWSGNAE